MHTTYNKVYVVDGIPGPYFDLQRTTNFKEKLNYLLAESIQSNVPYAYCPLFSL